MGLTLFSLENDLTTSFFVGEIDGGKSASLSVSSSSWILSSPFPQSFLQQHTATTA